VLEGALASLPAWRRNSRELHVFDTVLRSGGGASSRSWTCVCPRSR